MMHVQTVRLRSGLGGVLSGRLLLTVRPRRCVADCQARGIAAYGYEQAKALVFADYGEPKDVLKYVVVEVSTQMSVLHQEADA